MGWFNWFRRQSVLEVGDSVTSPEGNWGVIAISDAQVWLRPAPTNRVQATVVVPRAAFERHTVWYVSELPITVAIVQAERRQDVPHRRG